MKTLYLDLGMGAAGDMLMATLYELAEEKEKFLEEINALGLDKVSVKAEKMEKCGIVGSHMRVIVDGVEEGDLMEGYDHHHGHGEHHHEHHPYHGHECCHGHEGHTHEQECCHEYEGHHHEHECCYEHGGHHHHDHDHHHHHSHDHDHHHHSSMADIEKIIRELSLSDKVKKDAIAVYQHIAEAEAKAHGKTVTEIHFHEVGTMDAVADIVGVCMLMEKLGVEKVVASPVHVGSGHVHCAHGILPVPAPATAYILQDVPMYGGKVKGELCTPTGAALLKHFVTEFGDMPVMKVKKVGYGMGQKDFERANCLRGFLGETEGEAEEVISFSCNLDDMTAEEIGFAMERCLEKGALDVYTTAIGMKKNRPGTLLSVLCKKEDKDVFLEQIFKHTTTLGVREETIKRHTLTRKEEKVETAFGEMRAKVSKGYGVKRRKYEYDDISKIARERGMSIREVVQEIK